MKPKKAKQNIIAMVYDFDGTLSPGNMQEDTIFRAYKINKNKIWSKADKLVRAKGYERTLAYLKLLIYEPEFRKRPFSPRELRRLAVKIRYFPGVAGFFSRINRYVKAQPAAKEWGVTLEHYVISSGMTEIVKGTKICRFFKRIYACEYDYEKGRPIFPKLVINDTNKTQFLFRIVKGKLDLNEDINSHMQEDRKRIPFRNMVYIGDSLTDIPSMTVTKKYGGCSIGVFDPKDPVPSSRFKNLVSEGRVDQFARADWREGHLLDKIIKTSLNRIIAQIAYHASADMSRDWVRRNPD